MTLAELSERATQDGITLGRLAVVLECEESGATEADVVAKVRNMIEVMKEAVKQGLNPDMRSRSGLSGGDAAKVAGAPATKRLPGDPLLAKAVAYALSVAEVNASMGKIVAAPTAGSCGVIPGTFLAFAETASSCSDDMLIDALCAAGLVGQVIGDKASLAGAEAGCQAECGAAAAMAAAGITQLCGGSPEDCIHAAALALKGLMGLVCDPVAGLVEIPCVKRNATSASVALSAAEMALAGVRSRIPPDEVISAMAQVGRAIPASLRETAQGGLANTPTGIRCARSVLDSKDARPKT